MLRAFDKLLRSIGLAATVMLGGHGCGSDIPSTSSPASAPDSEAGRKARAEDERLIKERRAQEAKARKRIRGLPVEG